MSRLGHTSGVLLFQIFVAVDATLIVEKVVNRGMAGGEFLERTNVSELRHRFPRRQND
jgi:pantothenate kinase